MCIRRISRKRKDGSKVSYLQLAHKIRDPETGKPKDKILYHFGREDEIDADQIRRLIKSLSRFLDGAEEQARAQLALDFGDGTDVTVGAVLSIGGTWVLEALWRRLGLDKAINKALQGRNHGTDIERLIFAMVANRALDPRAKLAIERWVGKRVAIDGLEEVQVHQLYRAMDELVEHGEVLQREVFDSVATLLNLEVDLLFFDTTSTYFETDSPDDEDGLRHYGHSKDHRPDLPQVVIGLAATRSGLPVRCWVLEGETSDASLVSRVQKDMNDWRLGRVVWVVDRGFAGETQRATWQRGGGHVIVGEKSQRCQGGQSRGAVPSGSIQNHPRQPAHQGGRRRERQRQAPLRGRAQP